MPTTLIMIKDEDDVDQAFPTIKHGRVFKRENRLKSELRAVVLKTLPKKDLLCALFNNQGYADSDVTLKARKELNARAKAAAAKKPAARTSVKKTPVKAPVKKPVAKPGRPSRGR